MNELDVANLDNPPTGPLLPVPERGAAVIAPAGGRVRGGCASHQRRSLTEVRLGDWSAGLWRAVFYELSNACNSSNNLADSGYNVPLTLTRLCFDPYCLTVIATRREDLTVFDPVEQTSGCSSTAD